MSNVTLTIAGREYRVACAPGEEQHVAGLGRVIDGKLAAMDGLARQSEARTLLFAALLLADELHEAEAARAEGTSRLADMADRLEQFAQRLENIAGRLEPDGTTP